MLGSRIVEVHNGSALFTGKAGQGPSNLRQYILENDLLEAIVALPEKMFYNTGIGTYLWVLANKKEERRKGKVQLIDATSLKTPLRKNLGEKNASISSEDRHKILDLYMQFDKADPEYSKVFDNSEFGYWEVPVFTPRLDDAGKLILDKKGKPIKPDKDTEIIPFSYEGGICAFIKNEVLPYNPNAYYTPGTEKKGYEISFTKYFYKPVKLRSLTEIMNEINKIDEDSLKLMKLLSGGSDEI